MRRGRCVLSRDATEDFTAARIGYEDAGQDFDGGGFTRAIGADITDEFAGFNGEGDAVEGGYLAVVAVHDAAQRTPHTGLALGDLEGFDEVFDDDVGHARSQCAGLQAGAYVIYKIGISARVFQVVGIFSLNDSREMYFCTKIECPILCMRIGRFVWE